MNAVSQHGSIGANVIVDAQSSKDRKINGSRPEETKKLGVIVAQYRRCLGHLKLSQISQIATAPAPSRCGLAVTAVEEYVFTDGG